MNSTHPPGAEQPQDDSTGRAAQTAPAAAFEQSLDALQRIVEQLEAGNLGLSESLAQYERGVRLLKGCYESLRDAERKIERLVRLNDDGTAQLEPFDDAATDPDNLQRDRAKKRGYRGKKSQQNRSAEPQTSSPPLPPDSPPDATLF